MIKTAYLIAGGEGTRLRPLTLKTPKPMLDINGKPLVEHIIDHLMGLGIDRFFLSVNYKKEQIMDYFGKGGKKKIRIEYVVEDEPLGTAGGLNFVRDKIAEPFVMLNGDVLSRVDVSQLEQFHRGHGAIATLVLKDHPGEVSSLGVMRMDGDRILDFVEKPQGEPPSHLINAGFYLLDPEIFRYVPPEGRSMMEREVFPSVAREGNLYGMVYDGMWMDIGTPERLEEARAMLRKMTPETPEPGES